MYDFSKQSSVRNMLSSLRDYFSRGAQRTDRDVISVLFLVGFSAVSKLSGRGATCASVCV